MSDIIINGETYEGVESITVNKTDGEQETFVLPNATSGAKVYKHSIVIMGDYASSGYPTVIEVLSYSSSLANSYLNYINLKKLYVIGGSAYNNDVYGDMYFSDVFGNKASGVLSYYDWENGDGTEHKEEYREYDFSQHINDTWTDTVTEYTGG